MKRKILGVVTVGLVLLSAADVFSQPKASAKPIVIGVPVSTAYPTGWMPERGIRLAAEEINAAGGVSVGKEKRPLKLEVMDTRDLEPGTPISDALVVVEKLILEKKADFLAGGPSRSEATLAVMDLVAQYKKVHIMAAGSISPAIAGKMAKDIQKYKYSFRISGDSRWHGRVALNSLFGIETKYGLNKVFFIVQDAAYARAGADGLRKGLEGKGWKTTGYEVYPMGTTDFSSGLLKAKGAGRGILLVWMEAPEGAILAKQWYDMKVPVLPFGAPLEAVMSPGSWKAAQGKVEYCITNVPQLGNVPNEATPWTMKFNNAYNKRYGTLPDGTFSASGYESIYLLKDAIERTGTLDSEAVVKALEKTDMVGVSGRLRFNKDHDLIYSDNPAEGMVIGQLQWQAGKRVLFYPPGVATGEVKLPPWM